MTIEPLLKFHSTHFTPPKVSLDCVICPSLPQPRPVPPFFCHSRRHEDFEYFARPNTSTLTTILCPHCDRDVTETARTSRSTGSAISAQRKAIGSRSLPARFSRTPSTRLRLGFKWPL